MKLLIVDGIADTRNYYRGLVEKCIPNATVFECMNAEDAFFQLFEHGAEMIISSEILSFRSGYDLTRLVNKLMPQIPIIIIANDENHALDAIKTKVFEYLVKPLSENDFASALLKAVVFVGQRIADNQRSESSVKVRVRIGLSKGYKLVELDSIAYCIAEGAYTHIFYTNGTSDFSGYYLGRIEEILNGYHFARINRSVLVNLKQIKHIDKREELCEVEVGNDLKLFKMTKTCLQKLHKDNII
jgi:two-component system, LytTR family, response regulator